jgi:hypothetical protein
MVRLPFRGVVGVAFLVHVSTVSAATVWHVWAESTCSSGCGTSWSNAFPRLERPSALASPWM